MALTRPLASGSSFGGGSSGPNLIPEENAQFSVNVGGKGYKRVGNLTLGPTGANGIDLEVTGDLTTSVAMAYSRLRCSKIGGDVTINTDDAIGDGATYFFGPASVWDIFDQVDGSVSLLLKSTSGQTVQVDLQFNQTGVLPFAYSTDTSYGGAILNLTALNASSWNFGSNSIPDSGSPSTWTFGDIALSGSLFAGYDGNLTIIGNSLDMSGVSAISAESTGNPVSVSIQCATEDFIAPAELRNNAGTVSVTGPFSTGTVNAIVSSMYSGFISAGNPTNGTYTIGGVGCASPFGTAISQIEGMVTVGITFNHPAYKDMTVAGTGFSNLNGAYPYYDIGIQDEPTYSKDSAIIFIRSTGSAWEITDGADTVTSTDYPDSPHLATWPAGVTVTLGA